MKTKLPSELVVLNAAIRHLDAKERQQKASTEALDTEWALEECGGPGGLIWLCVARLLKWALALDGKEQTLTAISYNSFPTISRLERDYLRSREEFNASILAGLGVPQKLLIGPTSYGTSSRSLVQAGGGSFGGGKISDDPHLHLLYRPRKENGDIGQADWTDDNDTILEAFQEGRLADPRSLERSLRACTVILGPCYLTGTPGSERIQGLEGHPHSWDIVRVQHLEWRSRVPLKWEATADTFLKAVRVVFDSLSPVDLMNRKDYLEILGGGADSTLVSLVGQRALIPEALHSEKEVRDFLNVHNASYVDAGANGIIWMECVPTIWGLPSDPQAVYQRDLDDRYQRELDDYPRKQQHWEEFGHKMDPWKEPQPPEQETAPSNGYCILVEDENVAYVFTGIFWQEFMSAGRDF